MSRFEKLFILTVSIPFILILLPFVWYGFAGPESYYRFDPYVDTKTSKGYSPEAFENIEPGMDSFMVKAILGEPLYKKSDTANCASRLKFSYTDDGKLLNQTVPWYMSNDYAWREAEVIFDANGKVIETRAAWIRD